MFRNIAEMNKLRTALFGTAVYVGTAYAAFAASVDLSELNGIDASVFLGANALDRAGQSVNPAGDLNADGIDDVVIGAPYSSPDIDSQGSAYVVFGDGQGLPATVDLASLDGNNGFRIDGLAEFDIAGEWVSRAGDVNADGIDDLIIGSPGTSSGKGSAYIVFGSNLGFSAVLSLVDLDGQNGFAVHGTGPFAETGASVSDAGDFNGDGIDDVVIGAYNAGGGSGRSYVVFGAPDPWPASLTVDDIDGLNGIVIVGVQSGDSAGASLSGGADFNGDGVDDLAIGAPYAGPVGNNPGIAYIVFGDAQSLAHPLYLSSLTASTGLVVSGVSSGDWLGDSLDFSGDINGDGVDDLLMGAPGADPNGSLSGAAYLLFGSNQSLPATLSLADIDGSNGVVFKGVAADDRTGAAVAGLRDTDANGRPDFAIGAPSANSNGADSGTTYVLFGETITGSGLVDLALIDAEQGFKVYGANGGDRAGSAIGGCGDLNNDGKADIAIGAPTADPGGVATGAVYVLFGGLEVQENVIFMDGFE